MRLAEQGPPAPDQHARRSCWAGQQQLTLECTTSSAGTGEFGTSGRGWTGKGSGRGGRGSSRSLSPTQKRSMPPTWIRGSGRKTMGPRFEELATIRRGGVGGGESESAVGGGASLRISAAPRPFGAAGDHGTGSEPPDPRARLGLASRVVVGGLDGSRGEGTETGWLVAWGVCGSGERRGDGRRTVRT